MSMRALLTSVCFVAGLAVACKSPEKPDYVPECTCGQPETAFEGCLSPLCRSGEGNPDNPDCLCGPLIIGEEN